MLLVIDVGNTNTVAGVYEGKKLVDHWRFSSDRSKTADEFGMFMSSMLGFAGLKKELITDIIISSVVPPVLVPLCHMCERFFGDPVVLIRKSYHVIVRRFCIQFHAVKRIAYYNRSVVIYKNVLPVLLLKLDTEVGVPLHGGIHCMTQNDRFDQVTHPDPDPDFIWIHFTR